MTVTMVEELSHPHPNPDLAKNCEVQNSVNNAMPYSRSLPKNGAKTNGIG